MDKRCKDLTGKTFGRLTVINRAGYLSDGKRKRQSWKCLCLCGKTVEARGNSLTSGNVRSCGCMKSQAAKNIRWPSRSAICISCNKQFDYSAPWGKSKKTCSQECHKVYRSQYVKNLNKSSFTHIFKTILKNIRVQEKEIDLTWVLKKLEEQDGKCCKTGIELQTGKKSPWSPSLDRKDPTKEYTKENTQLVCLMYNYAKHTWTEKDVLVFARALLQLTDDGIPQFPVGIAFRNEEDL